MRFKDSTTISVKRKFISFLTVVLFLSFLLTSFKFLPKLEIKNENSFSVAFTFTARTLMYFNRICANISLGLISDQWKGKKASSKKDKKRAKSDNFFRFLILSVITAMLIPSKIRLLRLVPLHCPNFLKRYISIVRGNKAPPEGLIKSRFRFPINLARQNNNREFRAAVSNSAEFQEDKSEDNGSDKSQVTDYSSLLLIKSPFIPLCKRGKTCLPARQGGGLIFVKYLQLLPLLTTHNTGREE